MERAKQEGGETDGSGWRGRRVRPRGHPYKFREGVILGELLSGGFRVRWDDGRLGYCWQRYEILPPETPEYEV